VDTIRITSARVASNHVRVRNFADRYHLAFLACAVAMVVAVGIALGMRDLPLRAAPASDPSPQPATLAH